MNAIAKYAKLVDTFDTVVGTGVGKMFGKACVKVHGKAFLSLHKELMIFKLTGEHHRFALALEGASLWDPSGKGRPMKEWHPYEILAYPVQLQMLEAAATAIELIESKILNPGGEFAGLFLLEPQSEFTTGLQAGAGQQEPVNYWRDAAKAIEEALIEARHNPETARALFQLASYGRRDPASQEKLRTMFAKEQIPPEFLIHYEPEEPFACFKFLN